MNSLVAVSGVRGWKNSVPVTGNFAQTASGFDYASVGEVFRLVMGVAFFVFFLSHRWSRRHLRRRDGVLPGADNKPETPALETRYMVQYLDKVFLSDLRCGFGFFLSLSPLSGIWVGLACFTPSVIAFLLSFLLLLFGGGFSCYPAAVIGLGGV